jgi:nucleoside-diphosphate-sugar epimerase
VLEAVRPHSILHIAWTTEHGAFWSSPDNLDWVAATMHLARIAAAVGVQRFVGVGTCFEYAWPDGSECIENVTPVKPTTLYAVCKDATRRILDESDHFSFAWARLFYLYGPHEDRRRLVGSIASRLVAGQPAPLSEGRAVRDFLDARDAGAALAAITLSDVEGPVNVCSGDAVSVRAIAERLGRIAGRPDLMRFGELPDRTEPPRIVGSARRLHKEVGFRPVRDLDQGLADTYAWWRTAGD